MLDRPLLPHCSILTRNVLSFLFINEHQKFQGVCCFCVWVCARTGVCICLVIIWSTFWLDCSKEIPSSTKQSETIPHHTAHSFAASSKGIMAPLLGCKYNKYKIIIISWNMNIIEKKKKTWIFFVHIYLTTLIQRCVFFEKITRVGNKDNKTIYCD